MELRGELYKAPDVGTPELHKRRTVEERRGIAYVIDNAPLHEYMTRGRITEQQYFSGQKFYSQWYFAGHDLTAKMKFQGYDESRTGTTPQEKFQKRYRSAYRSMRRTNALIVCDVCIYQRYVRNTTEMQSFLDGIRDLDYYYENEEEKIDFD